jgi:RNase P subunit RPR2
MAKILQFPKSEQFPKVNCPGCSKVMKPSESKPVVSTAEVRRGKPLTAVRYICETCGTSTRRFIQT